MIRNNIYIYIYVLTIIIIMNVSRPPRLRPYHNIIYTYTRYDILADLAIMQHTPCGGEVLHFMCWIVINAIHQ